MTAVFPLFYSALPRLPPTRLAVLYTIDGSLLLRDFPEDEVGQDRVHNECITALRLALRQVSEARLHCMSTSSCAHVEG